MKHYAANSQETDRRTVDAEVDERALREIYLPAFEVSIKEGHAGWARRSPRRIAPDCARIGPEFDAAFLRRRPAAVGLFAWVNQHGDQHAATSGRSHSI